MTTVYIFAGFAIGFLIAWLAARSSITASYTRQISELQMQHATTASDLEGRTKSAEAITHELRGQIRYRDDELNVLRGQLDSERQLAARLEESQRHLREEIERFEAMELKIGETFKALSLDALAKNSDEFKKYADEFIRLAEEKLKSQATEGSRALDTKKELIDQNIEMIGKTLAEVQRKIEEVGKSSGDKLTHVATLIQKHEEVTTRLNVTTDHLKQALASSKKRGEWGERMAEDIIRLIGLVEGVNYIKQKTLEQTAGRPDYTFLLPNLLKVNMDVKFPMDNYQHYLDAQSDHDRKRFKEELLKNMRLMIRQVTSRDYINPAENTVDYVILFVPNEQVYGFINESDRTIMDEALKQKVILCSPFTLYAVLSVIRQAVENFNLERTASEILKLLSEFSKQWSMYKEKFRLMGERLDAAKKEYDAIATTRTNMLERPLRKIEELRQQKALGLDDKLETLALTDQDEL